MPGEGRVPKRQACALRGGDMQLYRQGEVHLELSIGVHADRHMLEEGEHVRGLQAS